MGAISGCANKVGGSFFGRAREKDLSEASKAFSCVLVFVVQCDFVYGPPKSVDASCAAEPTATSW